MKNKLEEYGYDDYFKNQYTLYSAKNNHCARIISDNGQFLEVVTKDNIKKIERIFLYEKLNITTGDFIVIDDDNKICFCLERKSKLTRILSTSGIKQYVAANFDKVLIVQSLNSDFKPGKLQRYLVSAFASGAEPIVVLTKSDLCDDVNDKIFTAQSIANGAICLAVSNITGQGIDELKKMINPYETFVLLGSSGVGKSSLLNTLAGKEIQATNDIGKKYDRGRHTTTTRSLIRLPDKSMIIDTPGVRNYMPGEAKEGINTLYGDIIELEKQCKFRNCTHINEPGCAVIQAINQGIIDTDKLKNYKQLSKEQERNNKKTIVKKEQNKKKELIFNNSKNALKQFKKYDY